MERGAGGAVRLQRRPVGRLRRCRQCRRQGRRGGGRGDDEAGGHRHMRHVSHVSVGGCSCRAGRSACTHKGTRVRRLPWCGRVV